MSPLRDGLIRLRALIVVEPVKRVVPKGADKCTVDNEPLCDELASRFVGPIGVVHLFYDRLLN